MRLSDDYPAAVAYAWELHRHDVRKGTAVPYLSHVLAVSAIVLEHGGSETQAIGALLHDAAEDHGGEAQLAEIAGQFGAGVAAIVRACSDDLPADGATKRPWVERKVAYLEHLERAVAGDDPALLVSAADKLANCRAIVADHREVGDAVFERFKGGRPGTLWYYRRLADVFTPGRLTDALRREVEALEALAEGPGVDLAAIRSARTAEDLRALGLPDRAWGGG